MPTTSIRRIGLAAAATLLVAMLSPPAPAAAAEIKVFCTQALMGTFARVGPQFEHDTGNKLAMTFGATAQLVARIAKGEAFDVAVLTKPAIEDLAKDGKLAPGFVDLADAGIGIAIHPGAARPDLSSTEAFKATMLSATSVSYTDPAGGGGSGVYAGQLMKRLGIAEAMAAKTKLAPAGTSSARLVANGEAQYAIQTISELLLVPGIEVAGPLPPEIQMWTTMSIGVGAAASEVTAAQALVAYLASPAALPVLKASGLEPVK